MKAAARSASLCGWGGAEYDAVREHLTAGAAELHRLRELVDRRRTGDD